MPFRLKTLNETFAICSLPLDKNLPLWVNKGAIYSLTRTPDEYSVVCPEQFAPHNTKADRGWKAFQILGPIPFDEVGVVASLTRLLAEAKMGVFVLSTYDADLLLIRKEHFKQAVEVFLNAGHVVLPSP